MLFIYQKPKKKTLSGSVRKSKTTISRMSESFKEYKTSAYDKIHGQPLKESRCSRCFSIWKIIIRFLILMGLMACGYQISYLENSTQIHGYLPKRHIFPPSLQTGMFGPIKDLLRTSHCIYFVVNLLTLKQMTYCKKHKVFFKQKPCISQSCYRVWTIQMTPNLHPQLCYVR